jgi:hypothetical protein
MPPSSKRRGPSTPYSSGRGFNYGTQSAQTIHNTDASVNMTGADATYMPFNLTLGGGVGGGSGRGSLDDPYERERKRQEGQYGFKDFYAKRSELIGGGIDYDWRNMDRPAISRGTGPLRLPRPIKAVKNAWNTPADGPVGGPIYDRLAARRSGETNAPVDVVEEGPGGPGTPGVPGAPTPAPVSGGPLRPVGTGASGEGLYSMEDLGNASIPAWGGMIAREGTKAAGRWIGGKIAGAVEKRRGAAAPGTQMNGVDPNNTLIMGQPDPISGRTPPLPPSSPSSSSGRTPPPRPGSTQDPLPF